MEEMNVYTDFIGKNITTMQTGGRIRKTYIPQSILELVKLIDSLDNFLVIGNGSNILIKDEGYDGNLIINNNIKHCEIKDNLFWAAAGTPMRELSQKALKNGFMGFEFMHDIPGTVGGGIYMNASAWTGDIASILEQVVVYRNGKKEVFGNRDLQFSYRHSALHNNKDIIILEAGFIIKPGNIDTISEKIRYNRLVRQRTQPLSLPSSGSIFKTINIKKLSKLRGYTIGGAQISEINPNFIVNINNAKTKDVLEIINYVQKTIGGELEVEIF